jgi:tellurite resistance protein TerC
VPDWLDINNWVSLGVIIVVLTVTTVVSLAKARRDERNEVSA